MDPLSALGVASNILAVVDFAWAILTEARTIHQSSSGFGSEAEFVDTITHDVSLLDQRLLSSTGATGELQVLVAESQKVVSALRDALSSLKTRKSGSKRQSCVAALKETWGRDKVSGLMTRLGTLRSRIMMHIQMIMQVDTKSGLDQILTAIKQLYATSKTLEITTSDNLSALQHHLLEAFGDQNMRNRKIESDVRELVKHLVDGKSDPQSSRLNQELPPQLEETRRLEETMRELSKIGVDLRENQKILGALHFSQMQARHHAIQAAHIETYEWIFQDAVYDKGGKPVRWRDWLETRSNTFWIRGKPGSGKSTLVKFLASHESTRTHLLAWAGQKKLVIGKFFFWRAGSSLQKSQQGLLRSLLYEILRQCPELLPVVKRQLPTTLRWDSWDDPDYENLLPVLLEAIASQPIPIRFCLFIDGLDEFQDERHSHLDLVKTLRKLDVSEDIKLCVASRPWTVFVDEFSLEAEWNLKLEDLTRMDIHRYVNDKFHEHSQFQILVAKDSQYSGFIDAVVDRAQGVFLWVFLVVRSLLEGLTYHDSLSTLQRRLKSFPSDLEPFFRHLIHSVPKVYHREMVRYFTIRLKSPWGTAAVMYSFLDDIGTNPEFLSKLPWKALSMEEEEARLESLRRRLDGISRGLLEIVYVPSPQPIPRIFKYKVDFIHRTVHDYLQESAELQSFFGRILQKENVMLAASQAALAQVKTDQDWGLDQYEWIMPREPLQSLFAYIHKALAEDPESSATLEAMLASFWVNHRRENFQSVYRARRRWFVRLAAQIDFLPYVESQLAVHPEFLTWEGGHEYATGPSLVEELLLTLEYTSFPVSLRVLEYLLAQGSKPNFVYERMSTWERLRVIDFSRGVIEGGGLGALPTEGDDMAKRREAIYHIARFLILHGADLENGANRRNAKDNLRQILPEETVDKLLRKGKYQGKQTSTRRWRERFNLLKI